VAINEKKISSTHFLVARDFAPDLEAGRKIELFHANAHLPDNVIP
jgi:hypothetical protein